MVQLFDIQNKQIRVHNNCYLIPELKVIIDTFPTDYLKILQYIAGMTVPDSTNPYFDIEEHRREEVILADIKPFEGWIEDMLIEKAIKKCEFLFSTPTLRAFMGAKKALDRIGKYLDETEITDGKEGTSMTIERYMLKLPEFTDTYNTMETKLKEEQAKIRGNLHMRYDQAPGYINLKEEKEEDDE